MNMSTIITSFPNGIEWATTNVASSASVVDDNREEEVEPRERRDSVKTLHKKKSSFSLRDDYHHAAKLEPLESTFHESGKL